MSRLLAAILHEQKALVSGIFHLRLFLPEPLFSQPPQFVRLSLPGLRDPYLPRPFVIFKEKGEEISIVYQVRGPFTRILSRLPPGETLLAHGPLGKPFPLPRKEPILFVGGGMGAATFYPYLGQSDGREVFFLLGCQDRSTQWFDSFFPQKRTEVVTEDGSYGTKGTLLEHLARCFSQLSPLVVIASGPLALLRGVQREAIARGIQSFLATEEMMACGEGLCLSCAIRKQKKDSFFHVCQDGPVLPGEEVAFDEA